MMAMVLAAGVGERIGPLTDYPPKPILPIAIPPTMGHILSHLSRHGFTGALANVFCRARDAMDGLGDGSDCGVRLSYAVEQKLWGSAGSVRCRGV